MTPADTERFWAKVQKLPGGCWEWTAGRFWFGHGKFKLNGKSVKAHRVSWFLANGEIPEGLSVLHECDNPPCVRLDHLFLGTQTDNMIDRGRKGRGLAGLVEADVLDIRSSTLPRAVLTEKYNICTRTYFHIRSGATWRHLAQNTTSH